MIALVTADAAASVDPDLLPLHAAMRDRVDSDAVAVVRWDDPAVDWASFAAVVIRSTWDYIGRLDEFLAWAERVNACTRLVNSADAIRWNSNKEYLVELAAAGVPIAPTTLVRPGERAPDVEGLHVVKPTVGAGSKGARRCESGEVAEHVVALHSTGRTAMVQPYLDLLDEHGETALCFVAGDDGVGSNPHGLQLSHAFRKGAILTSTTVEQVAGLFAKEVISRCSPSPEAVALAHEVLACDAIGRLGEIAFARVDVAPSRKDGADTLVVMEVELIEPSFYFDVTPGSADVFAERLLHRLQRTARVG